jgi:hypothetical protein
MTRFDQRTLAIMERALSDVLAEGKTGVVEVLDAFAERVRPLVEGERRAGRGHATMKMKGG